jgi:hypothetical protein
MKFSIIGGGFLLADDAGVGKTSEKCLFVRREKGGPAGPSY